MWFFLQIQNSSSIKLQLSITTVGSHRFLLWILSWLLSSLTFSLQLKLKQRKQRNMVRVVAARVYGIGKLFVFFLMKKQKQMGLLSLSEESVTTCSTRKYTVFVSSEAQCLPLVAFFFFSC